MMARVKPLQAELDEAKQEAEDAKALEARVKQDDDKVLAQVKAAACIDITFEDTDGQRGFPPVTVKSVHKVAKMIADTLGGDDVVKVSLRSAAGGSKCIVIHSKESNTKGVVVVKTGGSVAVPKVADKVAAWRQDEGADCGILISGGPIADVAGAFSICKAKGFDLFYSAHADDNPVGWALHLKLFILRLMHTPIEASKLGKGDFFVLVQSAIDSCKAAFKSFQMLEKHKNGMIAKAVEHFAPAAAIGPDDRKLLEFAKDEIKTSKSVKKTAAEAKERIGGAFLQNTVSAEGGSNSDDDAASIADSGMASAETPTRAEGKRRAESETPQSRAKRSRGEGGNAAESASAAIVIE
jgi:hypothetical protein